MSITPRGIIEFFTTPAESDAAVTLRAPEFNNTEEHSKQRVLRDTRGKSLRVYGEESWPKTYTYKMSCIANTLDEVEAFRLFVKDTLGTLIKIKDHETRIKHIIITDPNCIRTEHYRSCGYTIEFTYISVVEDVDDDERGGPIPI